MPRTMDAKAVAEFRRDMDNGGTAKNARRRIAQVALSRDNLTPCGRAEWEKELCPIT